MKFASKVIGQTSIVVVDAKIGRADFAHAKFLLLVRRGRHRIPIFQLGRHFLLTNILHFFHKFHGLFNFALGSGLLGLSEFFADGLGQLVDLFSFARDLG